LHQHKRVKFCHFASLSVASATVSVSCLVLIGEYCKSDIIDNFEVLALIDISQKYRSKMFNNFATMLNSLDNIAQENLEGTKDIG
jgi:hypothetical protein